MIVGILGVSLSLCGIVAAAQQASAEHRHGTSITRGAKGGRGGQNPDPGHRASAKAAGGHGAGQKQHGDTHDGDDKRTGNQKRDGDNRNGHNQHGDNRNGHKKHNGDPRHKGDNGHGHKKHGGGHGHGHADDDDLPGWCSYPPQRRPQVHHRATRSQVRTHEKFTVSGQVKINSCGVKHTSVGVFTSNSPSGPFTYQGSTTTTGDGGFRFTLSQGGTTHYKLASAPTSHYGAGTSDVFTVEQVR
jgi:hypothetical protein